MAFTDKFEANNLITTIPSAPALLANNLRASLIKSKIPITGKVVTRITDPNPETREFLAKYSSPTMVDIIYYTNQKSDNALAEALLKTVGFYKTGNVSLESGRETIVRHLQEKKYDFDGLVLADGSGLSRGNKVKPISQVKFLADVMKEKYYDDFLKSLPIAGETGTLRRMFKTSNNYGQIFAKTGTLNGVKCLAGYIKTKSGKTLTFSLLINGYIGSVDQIKARMEQLLEPVVDL
jgi:D-alanyl-D-alanine carboxypeptidase/D-alanyl-D-alanine-endopeptidase (penicillin-binding protein 4)